MPRRSNVVAADFPPPGTILTFPLGDGRFGACRVLRVGVPEGSNSACALVILTEYVNSAPPRLDDPAFRQPLLLNHHLWSNRPCLFWSGEPPPPGFEAVGIGRVTRKEAATDSGSFAAWESLPLQRILQWRWDHDRDALLAEEAIQEAEEETKRVAAAEHRAQILAETTLPTIQKRQLLFPRWRGHVTATTLQTLEKPIRTFIAALMAMQEPTRRDVSRELRICAKALNKFDAENNHPIESVERDDIFELFEEILTVAKQPDLIEKLDEWRDW